jgi:hypothetical protein
MALLDTASLIVTPNGYKASKLYSIVPTDGTGDMTFSRTGNTATRVNSSGLIEGVNANIPKLDYLDGTCPKLLLEPQRTNLALRSEELDNSGVWPKTALVTANAIASPSGSVNADKITDNVGTSHFIYQSISLADSTSYAFTIYLKAGERNLLDIRFQAKTTSFPDLVNLSTGVATNGTLTNVGNNWWRYTRIVNSGTGATTPFIQVLLRNASGSTTYTGDGVSGAYVWGAQLELGSFATSYIPTTTASVTRNLDSCSKSSISSILSSTEGTLFVDFVYTSPDAGRITIDDGSTNNRIWYTVQTSGITIESRVGGTISIGFGSSPLTTIGTRYKTAIAYKNNDFAFYINGSGQFLSSGTVASTFSRLSFDSGFSSFYFNNKVNSLAHWKTRLTNSELAQLTTL